MIVYGPKVSITLLGPDIHLGSTISRKIHQNRPIHKNSKGESKKKKNEKHAQRTQITNT